MEPSETKGILSMLWANKMQFLEIWAYTIAVATIIVKFTPTLKDDALLKKVVKFTGKYLAINKYGPKKK